MKLRTSFLLKGLVMKNNSNTASGGYKKRFEKLLDCHIRNKDSDVDKILQKDIQPWVFHYSEHHKGNYEGGYTKDVIAHFNKDDSWNFMIFMNSKQIREKHGKGWETFLEEISFDLNLPPVPSDPEYQDLLTEALKESIENIPEKLYHATYLPFLDSIKASGLGKTENKMWSDSKAGVVYLADDPWVAESYAESSELVDDEYLDNIIILEVDCSKLDSNKLFIDENVLLDEGEENFTWEYHGVIPWEACKIFEDYSIAEDFKLYESLWD